jgi:DNA (cytosine-5)-methyltransferase 1
MLKKTLLKTKPDIHQHPDDESIYRLRKSGLLRDIGPRYKMIDLFCGAGGLTSGFTHFFNHVFDPVWANDFNPDAARTYEANFGCRCTSGDILEIVEHRISQIPRADIVIGGPPCQGFSLLNRQRKDDSRKQLWRPFLQVVERARARVFVMENVPQLLGSPEHSAIVDFAESLGFKLAWAKLCAADYGVPQTRRRAFIVGCNFTDPREFFPPKKTHRKPDGIDSGLTFAEEADQYIKRAGQWRTVRDAIGDLPEPVGTEIRKERAPLDLHFGRTPTRLSLQRYMTVSEEGMNRFDLQKLAPELTPRCWIRKTKGGTDLFGRLWWDRPAFTIRTEFFKPEKGRYLHPSQHRPITHREAARLQSFPDSFKFIGTKTEIAKQIGNAVPPMLAARIADCVLSLFLSSDTDGCFYRTETEADYGENKGSSYSARKAGTQLP